MRIQARHYATSQPIELQVEGGIIQSVSEAGPKAPRPKAGWVAPAFFDIQVNGCEGISFNSEKLTPEQVQHAARFCRQQGIAALCPTLVTNSQQALVHGFSTLRKACEDDPEMNAALPAFHLEGPYISPEDGPRGAHSKQFVRAPDWDEFRRLQDAAGGRIRLLTLAPEREGALPFIEKLTAAGVVVALGHTGATGACIRQAIQAGAKLSTHLGNGSHAVLPRHDNYIWEQMGADELLASIIADGFHLPPSVVRCLVRVKTPDRIILTCDASSLAGLPAGRYHEWDQDLEVEDSGKVVLAGTPYLAGSGVFLDICVANVIRFAGVSLGQAVDMAGAYPRKLLGLPPRRLEAGMPADLVLFDWEPGGNLLIRQTLVSEHRTST